MLPARQWRRPPLQWWGDRSQGVARRLAAPLPTRKPKNAAGRLRASSPLTTNYLSRWNKRLSTCSANLLYPGLSVSQQVLDNLGDFHELSQARRLGDESRNAETLEQRFILPGSRRTPHAHRNGGEVCGAADLAQNVRAGIFGQVQIQQDQGWDGRMRIGPLLANKSERIASILQVDQLKLETLFLQSPFEQEDVRLVIVDHEDSGGED